MYAAIVAMALGQAAFPMVPESDAKAYLDWSEVERLEAVAAMGSESYADVYRRTRESGSRVMLVVDGGPAEAAALLDELADAGCEAPSVVSLGAESMQVQRFWRGVCGGSFAVRLIPLSTRVGHSAPLRLPATASQYRSFFHRSSPTVVTGTRRIVGYSSAAVCFGGT